MLGVFSWRRVHELQREGRRNEETKPSAIRRFKFEEELQKSEEKYRTLVENVNIGVYRNTGGPHGRFLQVNPALAKMHGYNSVEELMKVSVSDLYQNPEERRS